MRGGTTSRQDGDSPGRFPSYSCRAGKTALDMGKEHVALGVDGPRALLRIHSLHNGQRLQELARFYWKVRVGESIGSVVGIRYRELPEQSERFLVPERIKPHALGIEQHRSLRRNRDQQLSGGGVMLDGGYGARDAGLRIRKLNKHRTEARGGIDNLLADHTDRQPVLCLIATHSIHVLLRAGGIEFQCRPDILSSRKQVHQHVPGYAINHRRKLFRCSGLLYQPVGAALLDSRSNRDLTVLRAKRTWEYDLGASCGPGTREVRRARQHTDLAQGPRPPRSSSTATRRQPSTAIDKRNTARHRDATTSAHESWRIVGVIL